MKRLVLFFLLPLAGWASELKISSLNVHFGNEQVKETFALILRFDPHVILLQESTDTFKQGAAAFLPKEYAHSWFTNVEADSGGGFGVMSKLPILDQQYLEKSTGRFGAQVLRVQLKGRTVQIMNMHLNPAPLIHPHNRSGAMHAMILNNKAQVLEIRNLLKHYRSNQPTIIAGDLNSLSSLSAYKQLTRRGFIDAHLSCDPKAHAVPTWRMNVDGHTVQERFDYVFHNPLIEASAFEVVENTYSDHALINGTLEIKD